MTNRTVQEGQEGPRFYSVSQVAGMFGTSAVTIYRAIEAGEFPAVRIRGRLIIPAKAIDDMTVMAVDSGAVVDAARWSQPGGAA